MLLSSSLNDSTPKPTEDDLNALTKHIPKGGCIVHIQKPKKTEEWLAANPKHQDVIALRGAGIRGPFPVVMFSCTDSLALFTGSVKESICTPLAKSLADSSGFPVISIPQAEGPFASTA